MSAALTPARLIAAQRELRTARLRLAAPAPAHAAALMALVNRNLPTLGYIAWAQQPWTLTRAQRFCARALSFVDAGEDLVFHVFAGHGPDAPLIGRIDLHSFDLEVPRAEIGYVADATVQGQGLMREAVLAVLDFAFVLGFARIEAISELSNHRALHFAQSLGMVREGTLHHRERGVHGELVDQALFAAWPKPDAVETPDKL
ncbi:GNAT family N-acetyltransferase [Ideonella sp.]|jgi:RimJ/RimL family protein N-acetyltransferase|uniref:GNAT family N-acetyltransferase n=1 Tax=Ideonella sp. TaxID=1929293 RepID=UPI0037BF38CD